MANKRDVGNIDSKWKLKQNIIIIIIMQLICSYRVHGDLREKKKVTF